MPVVTVISSDTRQVDADVSEGRVLLNPTELPAALGWELKPEGLCRDDVCVPVRRPSDLLVGDNLDLSAVAAALGRPAVVDADAGLVAVALDAESRRQALDDLVAPPFALADLEGTVHTLDEWRGQKKLLSAFASW
jgi:hypothetical protein